jgi:uncharacterized protein
LTRIAVIADTHLSGDRELPRECAELIAGSDLAIHAGDVSSAAALAQIEAIGPPVHAVQGNVEDGELQRLLPVELRLDVEGLEVGVLHDAGPAAGRLARLRRSFPEAAAVVFGHSHMPLHETEAGFQIFNPGSPTQRRRAPQRTMGIAEVEGGEIRFQHLAL